MSPAESADSGVSAECGATAKCRDTGRAGATGPVPAAAQLLGRLALELVLELQRLALELASSEQFGLDRADLVEDRHRQLQHVQQFQQRHIRQPGQHLDEFIELEFVDLAGRLRLDQPRFLVFGKLNRESKMLNRTLARRGNSRPAA
jgi:hypothetical protein